MWHLSLAKRRMRRQPDWLTRSRPEADLKVDPVFGPMREIAWPGLMKVACVIEFEVPGVPRPQPRPRTRVVRPRSGGRAFAQIYNPDTNKEWKQSLLLSSRIARRQQPLPLCDRLVPQDQRPWDQAVRVDIEAFFDPPAWMAKWLERTPLESTLPMLEKPDRDNLDKVVLDVLTQEGWWLDDSHVYVGRIEKWYTRPDYAPGVKIRVQFEELQPDYLAIRRLHAGQLAKAKAKRANKEEPVLIPEYKFRQSDETFVGDPVKANRTNRGRGVRGSGGDLGR
jgi:Holliday junction resolvase RusA-like endonuclease